MKAHMSPRKLIIAITFLFTWLLAGCGASPEMSRKPSEDWGRGLPLSTNASGTVGMVVDRNGEAIHAVWPFWSDSGGVGIRYVQIDGEAQVTLDREVIQLSGQVHSPRLLAAGEKRFHLIWANRPESSKKWKLWYAQLDQQGDIEGETIQISLEASQVSQYDVVTDFNGGILIVWEDAESGGIFFSRVSSSGQKQASPVKIVAQGIDPSVRVDSQGRIHFVWLDGAGNLRYQLLDAQADSPVDGTIIARIPLGTGASMEGPVLGVTDQWVYVFWSILNQAGLEAGTAKTEHVVFPVGASGRASVVSEIGVLPLEEQPYRPDEGDYSYTQLVPASYVTRSSQFVYAPVVIQGQASELAVALAFHQQYRLDGYIQIVIAFMEDGEYKGYTLATKTQAISSDAVLSADGQGNLHLIWRDGFAGENVFYTTTAPSARAQLDRPTLRDISTVILAGGLESAAGILLFPLAFPWMFPGLIVLVGWRLVKNDEDLTHRLSLALLVISILAYQVSKVLIFPTMVEYVPFSAWVDIPGGWQVALRIGVPTTILGIAVGIAEWFRRRSSSSTLRYYLVVVVIDTIITLAVYGVNFLGAY